MLNKSLVIVPTYNERENLPLVVERILGHAPAMEVLIIDDSSPDGTGVVADALAVRYDRVHALHRTVKDGLGRAYCAGFAWALREGYEFVCEMDADLSHDPASLPVLMRAANDADLVLGSRYLGGVRVLNWPMRRLLLSMAAALYVRLITGMPFSDPTGGFKCFRRCALERLDLSRIHSNGYSFQIEVTHEIWRSGGNVVEIPIVFTDRDQGKSKMSGKIVREALLVVWKLALRNRFRRRPSSRSLV